MEDDKGELHEVTVAKKEGEKAAENGETESNSTHVADSRHSSSAEGSSPTVASSSGSVAEEAKKEEKEFTLTNLEAVDLANTSRTAKAGETLYYVDAPTLKSEKRSTQFEITIDPKLPTAEVEKERIQWTYNTTHLADDDGKIKVEKSVAENDNAEVSVQAGVPNADEKKVNVEWVKEDYSKISLTLGTSSIKHLEKALELNSLMDNISRKLEKIPFFKRMKKNEKVDGKIGILFDIIPFQQETKNIEAPQSNLYLNNKDIRGGFDLGLQGKIKQTVWGLPIDKIPVVGTQLTKYISAGVYIVGEAKTSGEFMWHVHEQKYFNTKEWKLISKTINPARVVFYVSFGAGAEVKFLEENDYLSFSADANGKANSEILSMGLNKDNWEFRLMNNGVYLDITATVSATFLGKKLETTPYYQRIELIAPPQKE